MRDEDVINHLLGYLSQTQIRDAVKLYGIEEIRGAMTRAGWGDCYDWDEVTR